MIGKGIGNNNTTDVYTARLTSVYRGTSVTDYIGNKDACLYGLQPLAMATASGCFVLDIIITDYNVIDICYLEQLENKVTKVTSLVSTTSLNFPQGSR